MSIFVSWFVRPVFLNSWDRDLTAIVSEIFRIEVNLYTSSNNSLSVSLSNSGDTFLSPGLLSYRSVSYLFIKLLMRPCFPYFLGPFPCCTFSEHQLLMFFLFAHQSFSSLILNLDFLPSPIKTDGKNRSVGLFSLLFTHYFHNVCKMNTHL